MGKIIKLTENDLTRIVKRVIKEQKKTTKGKQKRKELLYLDFSLDYNGKVESIDQVVRYNKDITEHVRPAHIDLFVSKLKEQEKGFFVSDDRTQVRVWVYDDGTMDVHFRYFNSPDSGDFNDYELNGIPKFYVLGVM
jgi:hypothetical protein